MRARVHIFSLTVTSRRLLAATSVALLLAFCAGGAAAQTALTDEAGAATQSLFVAVRKNDLPAVQSAITAGADIEAVNSWGLTPVDLAVDKGHYEIAHFILSLRSFRAKSSASAGKGARKQTQPQFLPRSSGSMEAQKPLGYGVIQRKSTSERGSAPPPLVTPAAPVAQARVSPIEDLTAKAKPSWPAGKPNPFDPDYVAPDATVTVIGKVYKPGQVPKEALKSGARQTIPGLPKLKKAPRKDIAVAQAPKASLKAPPKAPKVPSKAAPPKAAPKKTASANKAAAQAPALQEAAAPASVVSSAVPSVTSTATSTAAAPSEGFLDNVMNALTFGLLDKGDKEVGGDGVDIEAAPKKAPPRLAKAPDLTSPPYAEPGDEEAPSAKPPEPKPATASSASSGDWSVKDVETASSAKPVDVKSPPPILAKNYLKGTELTLGLSVKLGSPLRLPKKKGAKYGRVCVVKKSGSVSFCIKPVDWPSEIGPMVKVGTVMYSGLKSVVRYDEGRASRFHLLFPTGSFNGIVAYYTRRYGAPTESLNRSIAPLASRRRDNPTVLWKSVDPVTKQVTTLEVRKFDDARGGFPDTERGAVMLYHQYSKYIFPQLSTVELMLLRPNEVL